MGNRTRSGGKFENFTQQYGNGLNSVIWNSTTKFLVNKNIIIPTIMFLNSYPSTYTFTLLKQALSLSVA